MKGNNNNKQTKQKHTNRQKHTQNNQNVADEKIETEKKEGQTDTQKIPILPRPGML